jgi:predicted phage terminase large subunit-like protein
VPTGVARRVYGCWSALEREQEIRALAAMDRRNIKGPYEIGVEQEPGSGGKESAEATIRNLAGYSVFADRVTGSKQVRAEPFAAQVQGGNVSLVAGDWVRDFLDEAESFPSGRFKDQIDAAAGAFARLTSKPVYNLDAMQ